MYEITSFTPKMFKLNNIAFMRKFYSTMLNNKVRIYNAYDSFNVILDFTDISNVSVNGVVYDNMEDLQINLLDVIFSINENANLPDGLISIGDWTNVDGLITIPVGAQWRIDGVTYTNSTEWTTTLPSATTGFYRVDLIVGNKFNTFQVVTGEEDDTTSIPPNILPNTTEVLRVNIFGASFDPEEPPLFNTYVTKKSLAHIIVNTPNNNIVLSINGQEGRNTFRIMATGNGVIKSMSTLFQFNEDGFYSGKIFNIENRSGVNQIIKNNNASGGFECPFLNTEGEDIILKDKEIITYRFDGSLTQMGIIPRTKFIDVTGNLTLTDFHSDKVLKIKATCIITVTSGLRKDFNITAMTIGGSYTAMFVSGIGVTRYSPNGGYKLTQDKMLTMIQDGLNHFEFRGETTV